MLFLVVLDVRGADVQKGRFIRKQLLQFFFFFHSFFYIRLSKMIYRYLYTFNTGVDSNKLQAIWNFPPYERI